MENLDGAVAGPELALTGASHRDGDLGLEPISDSKNSDSDDSSEGLEERPLPVLSLAPVPPPVATAPPSPPSPPGLDPYAPAPAPASALQKPRSGPWPRRPWPDSPRRSPQGAGVLPRAAVAPSALQLSGRRRTPRSQTSSRRRWASSPLGPTGRSQARRLAHVRTRSPCWAQARHTCWDFPEPRATRPPPPPLPSLGRRSRREAEQVTAARRIRREGVSLRVAPGQVPRGSAGRLPRRARLRDPGRRAL